MALMDGWDVVDTGFASLYLRALYGYSQAEFAELIGVSERSVIRVEMMESEAEIARTVVLMFRLNMAGQHPLYAGKPSARTFPEMVLHGGEPHGRWLGLVLWRYNKFGSDRFYMREGTEKFEYKVRSNTVSKVRLVAQALPLCVRGRGVRDLMVPKSMCTERPVNEPA